jgi:hypothetical protein
MVAAPFFLFAFAIMGIGLQFFTINALEHGVESAARKIRTGQMQQGTTDGDGNHVDYTLDDFRDEVCAAAGSYINCDEHLVLHISSAEEWADIETTPCMTSGSLTPATGNGSDAIQTKTGGASQAVLVTACYEWDLGGTMWQTFWNLLATGAWASSNEANDAEKVIIQGVATFRTEPYS